ncbi:hypothetical protein IQ243_17290 [Nostocales cyanobacterium LEGE 11386]|nr:hypothetical protein [Nostocales cyanobacterium LEGE 11386]
MSVALSPAALLVPQSLQILANRRVRSQLFGNEKIKLRWPMAGNRMALSFLKRLS